MAKVKVMKVANQGLSFSSLGLPTGFYRADLLPDDSELTYHPSVVSGEVRSTSDDSTPGAAQPPAMNGVPLDGRETDDSDLAEPNGVSDGQEDEEYPSDDAIIRQQREASLLDEADFRAADHEESQDERDRAFPTVSGQYGSSGEILGHGQSEISIPGHVIEAAYVALDFDQGYPALDNGLPFWHQLDWEPYEAYLAFEVYLHQGLKGARQLFLVNQTIELKKLANKARLDKIPQELIREWSILYYWAYRAKAFDLFNTAAIRKSREAIAMQIELQHLQDSNRMYERLMVRLADPAVWAEMSPKDMLGYLKEITQLQRISVGLAAGGPSGKDAESDVRRHQSVETIMQQVAKEQGTDEMSRAGHGNAARLVEAAEGDTDVFEALQNAILRKQGVNVR